VTNSRKKEKKKKMWDRVFVTIPWRKRNKKKKKGREKTSNRADLVLQEGKRKKGEKIRT